jgi:hypothetical protein
LAHTFFNNLLAEFAEHIEHATSPRLRNTAFEYTPDPSNPKVLAVTVHDQIQVMDSLELGPYTPNTVQLRNLEARLRHAMTMPPIPTNSPLYAAKEMYALGMQTENKLVRFLILYSAVMLVAISKGSATGGQPAVDRLLLSINGKLAYAATGKMDKNGNRRLETQYTKIRNDFIHAEERGWAPDIARQEVERNVADFQRDVSKLIV